jgi:polyferredoxin
VQVCPTGIDIRKGLQYECIGCAACVDVCDTVMDKMNYPRGLIRFTTQHALKTGGAGRSFILGRILRPRVLVYGGVLMALTAAMMVSLALRTPLRVDVVRDRAALSRIAEGGKLENVYRLQIMNVSEQPRHFHVSVSGLDGIVVASTPEVDVDSAQERWLAVRVQVPFSAAQAAGPGVHAIHFRIDVPSGDGLSEKSTFVIPR